MTTTVTEAGDVAVLAPVQQSTGHRYKARLIEGDRWGSSGYYSRKVLERDGPKTWPEGTPIYLDHPSRSEDIDRPERSVKDLAGKITTTPAYEADGLYAEVEFYPHVRDVMEAIWEDVGMSIRAAASIESGTVKGRRGPVVTELHEGLSVDVVTRAGAGGKLVALLESARENAAITDSLPDTAGSTNKKEGHPMATIEESRLTALESDSRRVTALEAEKSEAVTRAEEAEAALAAANQKITELTEAAEAKETAAREARVTAAEAVIKEAYGQDAPAFIVEAAKAAAAADKFNEAEAREAAKALHAAEAGKPSGIGQVREDGAPKHTIKDAGALLLGGK